MIAGYDVQADKSPDHALYVEASIACCMRHDVDLFILLGGATNPDFPRETEAWANYKLVVRFLGKYEEILLLHETDVCESYLSKIRLENEKNFPNCKPILPIVILDRGHTSAETLMEARLFLIQQRIPVDKLVLCCEMARLSGFSVDGLYKDVNQMPKTELIFFGYRFPESQCEFAAQKEKMLFKLLSHRSPFFAKLRLIWQKRHQRKVAKIKRQQSAAPRP